MLLAGDDQLAHADLGATVVARTQRPLIVEPGEEVREAVRDGVKGLLAENFREVEDHLGSSRRGAIVKADVIAGACSSEGVDAGGHQVLDQRVDMEHRVTASGWIHTEGQQFAHGGVAPAQIQDTWIGRHTLVLHDHALVVTRERDPPLLLQRFELIEAGRTR